MKCAIIIIALALVGCSKETPIKKSKTLKAEQRVDAGCYLEYGAKYRKWLIHHYEFTDSNGVQTNMLSNGIVWTTAGLIKIQTSIENTCQYFYLDPSTGIYTMDGQTNGCGFPYGIETYMQFVDITIPRNANHPSNACYVTIVGQVF